LLPALKENSLKELDSLLDFVSKALECTGGTIGTSSESKDLELFL
jgi:hypothetical protein